MNKQHPKLLWHTLLLSGMLVILSSQAETVKIPVSQQGSAEVRAILPATGQTKAMVKQKSGPPLTIRGPIGNPPISTWTYSDFTVYFEYDHVIHAVVNPKKR
jgi:hypothetical protein